MEEECEGWILRDLNSITIEELLKPKKLVEASLLF